LDPFVLTSIPSVWLGVPIEERTKIWQNTRIESEAMVYLGQDRLSFG
jgi:hypothetical protein